MAKAGKKAKVKKGAKARKVAPRTRAVPKAKTLVPSVAAAAEAKQDEFAEACKAGSPRIALVGRSSEQTPVQIKDAAHLAKLREDHGESSVVLQEVKP